MRNRQSGMFHRMNDDGKPVNSPRQIVAAVLAFWLLAPAAALPQQPEDPRARIRTTVQLVVVPVTVKDPSGRTVADIRQEEFRIFEDNVEQKISLFSLDPFPLSAVVLLDNALRQNAAAHVAGSLRAIAGGFSESDEVALCRFDTEFQQLTEFTADTDKLLTALKRIDVDRTFPGEGSGPMTAGPRINAAPPLGSPGRSTAILSGKEWKNIDDALFAASQLLRTRERGRRRVIYLISDGVNSGKNNISYGDTLKALLTADISVYAIGVGDVVFGRPFNILAKYAHSTGGDVYYAAKRADLEDLYARMAEQARNQYTLGYIPQDTNRKVDYHSIEVRVRRPGLSLLARDGYYAPAGP